jgi:hypothetical protein
MSDYPSPGALELRSAFLAKWRKHPRVRNVYGNNIARADMAGISAWEKAKARSVVSVTSNDDQFLVFED